MDKYENQFYVVAAGDQHIQYIKDFFEYLNIKSIKKVYTIIELNQYINIDSNIMNDSLLCKTLDNEKVDVEFCDINCVLLHKDFWTSLSSVIYKLEDYYSTPLGQFKLAKRIKERNEKQDDIFKRYSEN